MADRLFPDSVYAQRKGETKDQQETRLYKAVRVGEFYCAPRCGCRCTWAAYQLAVAQAKALCKRLGKGWVPRVWENGGWHYQANKGTAEVHPHHHYENKSKVSYAVWLQSEVSSITSVQTSMQIIIDVPMRRDGSSNIEATLKKALALKRKAAQKLLDEAAAVEA